MAFYSQNAWFSPCAGKKNMVQEVLEVENGNAPEIFFEWRDGSLQYHTNGPIPFN